VEAAGQAYPAAQSPLQLALAKPGKSPYRPGAQSVQALAPARLYLPGGQTAADGLVEPATQANPAVQGPLQDDNTRPATTPNRPASQGPLQLALGRPDVDPYRPAAQLLHTLEPDVLNCPAVHAVAVAFLEAAGHAYPAVHRPLQLALGMAAETPYRPGAQSMHTAAPDKLYLPDGHAVAVTLTDPAGHTYPALQLPVHVDVVSPDTDPNRPASQGPLQLALGMPDTAPYRPGAQSTHTLAPARLYFPAGHATATGLVDPATHAYPAVHSPLHADVVNPEEAPKVPAGHKPVHTDVDSALVAP
jgi:hypothetical protein